MDKFGCRSYFSHVTEKYEGPISVLDNATAASKLLMDWVGYKLYFLNSSRSICRSDLLGTVALAKQDVSHITIDPYERLLFYTEGNNLTFLNLSNFQTLQPNETSGWGEITRLFVDLPRHLVYVINVTRGPEGDSWSLVRARYTKDVNLTVVNMTEHRVVYKGAELERATGLAVLEDMVVWTSTSQYDTLILYVCRVYLCSAKYLEKTLLPFQNVTDMKLYSSEAQRADVNYTCTILNCPNNTCIEVFPYIVQCVCPPGQTYDEFNNLCIEVSRTSWLELFYSSVRGLLTTLQEWVQTKVETVTSNLLTLVLCCCLLMLLLLEVCLCLIPRTQQPSAPTRAHKTSLETIMEI